MTVLGLGFAIASGGFAPAYGEDNGSIAAGAQRIGNIRFQSGLRQDQFMLLSRDRRVLQSLEIGKLDTLAIRDILGTSSASPTALTQWLEDRVQAVVEESFDKDKNVVVFSSDASFENQSIFPSIEKPSIPPLPGTGGVMVMSNLGASLYYYAKRSEQSLGVKIPGIGTIKISSPRAGVIKIGPGLFAGGRVVDKKNPDADANSIARLMTFFHEARHSDGNGRSLGFFHAVCPERHALARYHACDRNLNGSYTVGATMLKGMTESCVQCTVGQREKLRLLYLDSFGRVLSNQLDGTPTTHLDASPEGKR